MQLTKEQLLNTEGGAFKIGVAVAIGGIITFVIGVIDGYLRPLKCR